MHGIREVTQLQKLISKTYKQWNLCVDIKLTLTDKLSFEIMFSFSAHNAYLLWDLLQSWEVF